MKRLLIIACSATKKSVAGRALDVYDGPVYRILRKALRENELDLEICILSAKYGLIQADTYIEPYNQRMTPEKALALRGQATSVLAALAMQYQFGEVYIEMGQDYRPALPNTPRLQSAFRCQVREGSGGIGERGSALKQWLLRPIGCVYLDEIGTALWAILPDIACLGDDGMIDDGMYGHLTDEYAQQYIGADVEWVLATIRNHPGIWTAHLCRSLHGLPETEESIVHCGLCKEYANPRKRQRANDYAKMPTFDGIDPPYQIHSPCSKHGLTWIRHLIYKLRDQGRVETKRARIPDYRQARGWDWATRIYPREDTNGL